MGIYSSKIETDERGNIKWFCEDKVICTVGKLLFNIAARLCR
jgi:hypothetical protein